MSSIYQQQLGADFAKLHPRIQERLAFGSADHRTFVGEGTMARVWHGAFYARLFLWVGLRHHILFPETGQNVPFRIENYAYRDLLGRETVTWIRRFTFPRHVRCFDATMIYSASRKRIVDYLGTHQLLAVDIDFAVTARGGLQLRSGEQRFYGGGLNFRLPALVAALADVEEWYDDEADCYRIEVVVHNKLVGKLFGYTGSFRRTWRNVAPADIPAYALPVRYESRE